MDAKKDRIAFLWNRFLETSATQRELDELFKFLETYPDAGNDLSFIDDQIRAAVSDKQMDIEYKDGMLKRVLSQKVHEENGEFSNKIKFLKTAELQSADTPPVYSQPVHRVHFLKTSWFRYAAAVVIAVGLASVAYLWTTNKKTDEALANGNKQLKAEVPPGGDKAILTLADGKNIVLDSVANGQLATQGGVNVIKSEDGQITYDLRELSSKDVMWNTMTTPRGGQYQLVLPDGSRVWLNSASSLKYPVLFKGKQRIVELEGEAYFDIKANSKMPFLVRTNKSDVLVLGTAFNINSYKDEPSSITTLVHGSIKVSVGNQTKVISPGQQIEISNSQPEILTVKKNVDINQAIAWQRGIFKFDGVSLGIIARQLGRWYDVDVLAKDNNNDFRFSGGITKKTPLKTLLKILEANGVMNKWENGILTLYLK